MRLPAPNIYCAPLRLLYAGAGVLIVVLLVGSALIISQLRDRALVDEQRNLRNLSLTMAEQGDRVFQAVDLVILAASHAAAGFGGTARASVYVLKMGQPARILDLAERMIRLAGYEPGVDIEITFTGARRVTTSGWIRESKRS